MKKKKRIQVEVKVAPSKTYRAKRDRVEIHVEKGLRNDYKEAIFPETLKGGIESHMKQVVQRHQK